MASKTIPAILGLSLLLSLTNADQWMHLEPGKLSQSLKISPGNEAKMLQYYAAFIHSSYKGTDLSIRLHCESNQADLQYRYQFVVRTSPCDREFPEALSEARAQGPSGDKGVMYMYFEDPQGEEGKKTLETPFPAEDYKEVYYYKSAPKDGNCDQPIYVEADPKKTAPELKKYPIKSPVDTSKAKPAKKADEKKKDSRRKRETVKKGSAVNGTAGLNSHHPAITLNVDAIYLLIVRVEVEGGDKRTHNFTVEVDWRGPHGYLSAIDWPLLPFYGVMCGVYAAFALAWLIVSACQWKDLLRIQFWIDEEMQVWAIAGAVIILGMVEKAVFYADYQTVNSSGNSVQGAIQLAEVISCLKRTLARMLIIIVSVGFGVVKPRLGSTLHKVVGVGFVYFVLSSIEAINRTSNGESGGFFQRQNEGHKQKQLAGLPLTLLEVGIFWWIFSSLVNTMRALRLRRNEVKLSLYRHFTNTLIFAVLASVAFMCWSLYMHTFTTCLKDWTELWVDTAFWHVLFSVILLVIMILWRPTNNNQRYAFTPLLDAEDDDDDDEDTIYSDGAFTTAEQMKMRGIQNTTKAEKRGGRETSLEDELKWVEEHIPSSLADKALPALVDSEEEEAASRLEMSKIQ